MSGNSDLPASGGNDGVAIWQGWAGVGGFLSAYGEGALAGPLRQDHNAPERDRIVSGAVVMSLGNLALSFGNEQMQWGVGHFGQISQSTNASAFPALRLQNIHPSHLPGFLRYLGLFRGQFFLGQLDSNRKYSSPWIAGQILTFKPLPNFEFGLTHTIAFGGRGNDSYSGLGFFGRLTGLSTGNSQLSNSNTRVSIFAQLRIPSLRGTRLYGEILSEDFYAPLGHNSGLKLPFKGPSYQLGIYLPRLTRDGLTDLRLEWALLDAEYSQHNDSLNWTYDGRLMGHALGPHAQRLDLAAGRWLGLSYKATVDAYYELRQPPHRPLAVDTERTIGMALELWRMPIRIKPFDNAMADFRVRTGVEYVTGVNYLQQSSMRALLTISIGLTPRNGTIIWR